MDLVVTDLNSRDRGFPSLWQTVKETRRLNGYSEVSIAMHQYDKSMPEISQIGLRAMKVYESGVLRFYGTIWEPLDYGSGGVTIPCRDPYAYFSWRRVRTQATIVATDAGAIAQGRVTAQNTLSPTHLRNGSIQTSVPRSAVYLPGKLESELIEELAAMSQGFFFVINPVDGVPGTFAEMAIKYPNAGATHDDVRFEYGRGTADNLKDYKITLGLPRNRWVAASSSSTGGRIVGVSESTASSGPYGIIEDETALSDITDTTLLKTFADGEVFASPTRVYTLTPNINSPLLHEDFDAGDFVRLIIYDGPPDADLSDPPQRSVDVNEFVRVVEATMVTDSNGVRTMESVTVETLIGGRPYERPEDIFRRYLDAARRRAEMVERKVQTLNVGTTAPPATGGGTAPPDPDPTPDPGGGGDSNPPPAPPKAPHVLFSSATPGWDDTHAGHPYVHLVGVVNTDTSPSSTVWWEIRKDSGGSPDMSGTGLVMNTPNRTFGPSGSLQRVDETAEPLVRNTTYWTRLRVTNPAGSEDDAWHSFHTPNVQAI